MKEWTGHIVFESQPVADCFLEIKSQMIQYLRQNLQNDFVELTYEVATFKETAIKSQRELWMEVLEHNRLAQRLQTMLGLELE